MSGAPRRRRAVIAVVCPEPATWLAPVVEAARSAGEVRVLAPWALPWGLGPRRRRLRLAPGELVRVPLWGLADLAVTHWAAGDVDRVMWRRFATRALVGRLADAWLARAPQTRVVVAPTCGARRVFAAARARGAGAVLVEDLPSMRELHADLDAAARAHPTSSFLTRHRAAAATVAEQEAERVLADHVLVRGAWARALRAAEGASALALPLPVSGAPVAGVEDGPRWLLAGSAAARHGVHEALAALEACEGGELLVQPGEGAEPADLLRRPRVRRASDRERTGLDGVTAVLAPAWCESWLPEVARAAAIGVPVVATTRGAGFAPLEGSGAEVERGDVAGLAAALRRVQAARPARGVGVAMDAAVDALRLALAGLVG